MTGSRAALRIATLLCLIVGTAFVSAQGPQPPRGPRARVIVQLRSAADAPRVIGRLAAAEHRVARRYRAVPFVALEVSPAALAALRQSPDVVRVFDDEILKPVLAQSVPQIQGDQVWTAGYDGLGVTIAVLDTGVDAQHPFLGGRVIDEACFSSTVPGVSQSACPNGTDQQLGPGAGAPCALDTCYHGTHVAGIAAGNGTAAGVPYSGVARRASLMSVQVFSVITDPQSCGGFAPCAGAFSSDIIAGLEYVHAAPASLNIAAVNMSLGGTAYTSYCDDQPYKPAIDNLRAIGIASVVASGNEYAGTAISSPACISSAVSVGAVDDANSVAFFSNVAPFLSLFAPGDTIRSSVPNSGFEDASGTSMAAPHVAGGWALIRQAMPGASVSTVLNAMRSTGRPITDDRPFFGGGATVPRVSLLEALGSLVPVPNPTPSLTSFAPARLRAGLAPATVTLNGANFNAFSIGLWNGAPKPTTIVSTTQLQMTVPGADLVAAVPAAQVSVRNPSPGGGQTASLTVPIDPPPSLVPNTLTVAPGGRVTVTLLNGLGISGDWMSFASTSAANSSYLTFTYVGTGVTTRTWQVTAPSTPGNYEFRLFTNNTNTRVATSPTVVVDPAAAPVDPPVLTVNATTVAPGAAVTVTLTNGAGGLQDWLALAPTSAPNTSYSTFTYVGSGVTTRTWTVNMPSTPGPYEFRLFLNNSNVRAATSPTVTVSAGINAVPTLTSLNPSRTSAGTAAFTLTVNGAGFVPASEVRWNGAARPTTFVSSTQIRAAIGAADVAAVGSALVTVFSPAPGGGTSGALTFTIAPPPSLTVSTTTAAPGSQITVTLTNGLGGLYDWLSFAPVSAPNTSYLKFLYIGGGTTTRTWTVTAPTTPGTYEFRLFLNNSYVRSATSPPVVVQ
jgi:hypothetical protein